MYAKDVHVRLACLNAIKCIPAVASRSVPENVEVATSLWIALHDPEKVWFANCGFFDVIEFGNELFFVTGNCSVDSFFSLFVSPVLLVVHLYFLPL